ncbi:1-deoxypentalenic acid 11-beta-hydroxylase [BD1-7 clade bacterium]|uniref:1-deoxypentalenic acid 11-beta-hydroxylase n=1 Tax=BD1-7 clade bacterium TaxID=2029982 RepID=A0A5S9QL84_9GAMM|nr:1-deoxypentalenic acid 11-beta-hydroxylase [BD1-7 clade bacterium]CAA0120996.1 1-deoxypentalenic acid 11-beta-hydroxylase [BD1-7 clade bacterium]
MTTTASPQHNQAADSSNEPLIISRADESPERLRERFHEWGYLYFQQYVPAKKCNALMQSFADVLEPHLSLDKNAGHPVLNGDPFFETDTIWDAVYPKMQSLESFQRFFHDKPITDLMEAVTGTDVFIYPMKMARISTPKKIGYETPPHQDAHSHHAPPTMAGIWVPLHDVDAQMGRLKLLPQSHKRGVRPVHEAAGVGGVQCEIYEDETTWHVSDVKQGDVIIFHSACIHKAEPNTANKAARFSVDTRFCDYGAPVFVTNLDPHHGWRIDDLSWESIYEDWQSDDLQYYWKDYPNFFDQFGQGGF